jgi:hypothetical protein
MSLSLALSRKTSPMEIQLEMLKKKFIEVEANGLYEKYLFDMMS